MGVNRKGLKNNQGLVLLLILSLAIGGFILYRDYSIKSDKDRFEQAKASIDRLYEDIVANAGEPANAEKSQTCGRAEFKNTGGPLSCMVRIAFVYGVENNSDATEKYQKIKTAIQQNTDVFTRTFTNESEVFPFSALEDDRDEKEIGVSISDNNSGIVCSFRNVYAHGNDSSHRLTLDSNKQALSGSLTCQDSAKAEHYPAR